MRIKVLVLALLVQPAFAAEPECLVPRIDFWEKVYTKYDVDQGIVVDTNTMEILDVVDYPEDKKAKKKVLAKVKKKYPNPEVKVQRGISSKFEAGMVRYEMSLGDIVHREVESSGLPIDIALLPHVESSYDPNAVSKARAAGLFQIMPFWVKPLGLKNYKQLKDPLLGTKAATKLMQMKHREIEYWPLTITAWNQGVNAMARAQTQFGNDICAVTSLYEGKRFGYSGKNFYAALLAVERIVEKRQSPTWLRYKKEEQ
jgi:membrane-bound lytic murein transglycosylase D